MRFVSLLLFFCCFSFAVQAQQTVVLVHGYLGDGHQWRTTGIVAALHYAGWQDRGHLAPWGIVAMPPVVSASNNVVYTVHLPSEAPLLVQAQWLNSYLNKLHHDHPDNELVLVGHSAGGVVARISLLQMHQYLPIQALISIAAPHLGTETAELGLWAYQTPLSWFAPLMGLSTLNRSQGLYHDLMRENPATILFWVNRQPHPSIEYFSLVRDRDDYIAPWRQDLNHIPALHGRAHMISTAAGHALHFADGAVLIGVLRQLQMQQ